MRTFLVGRIARGVRYRIGRYIAKQEGPIQAEPDKVPAARSAPIPTRINVGCGYDKRPGYLNIDVDPACSPDILIVNEDDSLVPRGHFEEVVANDVLEHVPRAK